MQFHSSDESDLPLTRREWLGLNVSLAATMGIAFNSSSDAAEQGAKESLELNTGSPSRFEIWDQHCHLSGVTGKTPADRMDNLFQYADRLSISKLVLYMGWPFQTTPSAEELIRQNNQVLDAIKEREDRALAYVYVSPQHLETSLAEMKRCIEQGPMVGVKLWVAGRADDDAVDAIVTEATRLNAVVFQHTWIKTTGNLPGESTPGDLIALAERHPEAKLICGHAGGNWELGIRAVRNYPHVSLGIAGSDPTNGLVEMAVRELGAERVIYGSDAGGRSFASQLAKVYGAEISDEEKQLIFAGNLKRLLSPILETKGFAS
ncbi:Amidohydrolase [Polystyrenella longa]|uniref:Amidohydrolase n=1 Tax=Polystyrenella longa TaxID=2528007 RepID=A0A518CN44_9PLAN|nr:amidohydrolase family protein [Polystyrenella longa]QDU80623.1 Amidohydrolase [Polystyrenella longa]